MDTEKYLAFKNLGEIKKCGLNIELVNLPGNIRVLYDRDENVLELTRGAMINGKYVKTIYTEKGLGTVFSLDFNFYIKDCKEGIYQIESEKHKIDFCLKNEIIILAEVVDDFYGITWNSIKECHCYGVKFNKVLGVDFSEVPENIIKYFESLRKTQPCELMFLDLELEII